MGCHDVVLHTDHMNLVTFRIVHVKGDDRTQLVADGLSRLHVANMFESHSGTVANVWAKIFHDDDNGKPRRKMQWERHEEQLHLHNNTHEFQEGIKRQEAHLITRRCVPWRPDLQARLDDRRRPGLGYFGKNDFKYVGNVTAEPPKKRSKTGRRLRTADGGGGGEPLKTSGRQAGNGAANSPMRR